MNKGLPKALLPIGGQALISRWVRLLSPLERLKKVVVLSNDKYFGQFEEWKKQNDFQKGTSIFLTINFALEFRNYLKKIINKTSAQYFLFPLSLALLMSF